MSEVQKKAVYWITAVGLSIALSSIGMELVNSTSYVGTAVGLVLLAFVGVWWIGRVSDRTTWPFAVLLLCALGTSGCGYSRIEPGHVGIKVNLYGGKKGLDFEPVGVGMYWYNPWTTSYYEYPTFVQTAIWTKSVEEGSKTNEELSFNTLEGMVITGDISLSYSLDGEKVPAFFAKFRSDDLNKFTHGFMRNVARDAFNETAVKYTVEQVYGEHKEALLVEVRERINAGVKPYGITVEQFGFIGAPRLPENVVAALNSKIQATQDAIRVENELRQTKAAAQKAVAKAEGAAQARFTAARAEAASNKIIADSITPQLVQYKFVQKWDGRRPTVEGTGSNLLLGLPPVQ